MFHVKESFIQMWKKSFFVICESNFLNKLLH